MVDLIEYLMGQIQESQLRESVVTCEIEEETADMIVWFCVDTTSMDCCIVEMDHTAPEAREKSTL